MTGFERHTGSGAIIVNLTGFEADLLRSLASQMVELLHAEHAAPVDQDPFEALMDFSGPVDEPEDPVLARLFPTAYRHDADAAADFRRFTEGSLRDGKVAVASTVIDALEDAGLPFEVDDDTLMIDVELDEPGAMSWLKAFTDIRLALAVRLGVEDGDEEFWDTLSDDDPRAHAHDIYEWVGYLQETLVEALS